MLLFPIINIIIEFTIIIIAHRVGKYDIQATILDSLEFQNESAFISFTLDKRYIGCNNIALERFPILKDFRVDSKISEDNDLSKILLKQIDGFATNNNGLAENFQYGKMHYKSYLRNLFHGNKICGYMFRIEDDTNIQRYIKLLDQYNNDLIADVRNKDSHIKNIQQQMILGMANMVECRDRNTIGHFQRTSEITRILVDEMKKDDNFRTLSSFLDNVANAAPMHDLGKIAVDDAILRKPGKFTPEEYEVMKTHAEKGAAIVENLLRGIEPDEVVGIARNVANYHHERWDGTGYPRHLKGEEIPFESRIVAIADVYDALVSFRCYKEKMSYAEAFDTIVSGMGTQFDPKLKKYFINCHKEFEAYYDSCENK
jgi:putative two-component system response regulator